MGYDVKTMQLALIALGYDLGVWTDAEQAVVCAAPPPEPTVDNNNPYP